MKTNKLITLITLFSACFLFSCEKIVKEKEVVKNKIEQKAIPFDLSAVRLLDGSPFKHAMDMDGQWLLDLEPDRLLHRFRLHAGLEPKGEIYGGWELAAISGHTLGHYLSACAMMYAASRDKRFKERVDYIVKELAETQDARGTGYLGAIPGEDELWDQVAAGDIRYDGFILNGVWVPWYTQHKVWAGLIDAYLHADNQQAKDILIRLTDWAVDKFGHLTEEQFQMLLASEFGGMNESFAEMYAITGNENYLRMVENFYHKVILDPLKERRDELEGKHSNTQVPKIVGVARMYELTAEEDYHTISTFYWDRMVNYHTYLNGGNSNHEHLGPPGQLNDRLSPFTSETCNTYNMLKLTKHLFTWEAASGYAEYYERALYNHILASQNPEDGMVCYSVALESGTEKVFSTRFDSFWCCVSSGIENHVKYGEAIYFQSDDNGLMVNLFIPSDLNWKERDMKVRMETKLPEDDRVVLKFDGKKQRFPVHIRYPRWAHQGVKVILNGTEKVIQQTPGSYFMLEEEWDKNTELILEIPLSVYTESMPDNPRRVGFFYGPVLLSAELGQKDIKVYDIPVFISDTEDISGHISPVPGKSLTFTSGDTTVPSDVQLIPFYRIYGQKHAVYFDIFTQKEWKVKEKEYQQMIEKQKAFEARVVDNVRLGEMQPERDHNLASANSNVGEVAGLKYRDAFEGWFSFEARVDPSHPLQMVCTYWGMDKDTRDFDIYIDDILFREVSLKGTHGNTHFDEIYNIPAGLVKGKEKIKVEFRSKPGNHAGGVFGFKIMRKE